MKLKIKKLIFITIISLAIILGIPKPVYAMYQYMNELDFQIDVKDNGDLRITEYWNIDLEDTNTLFKTFYEDGNYDGITNVEVKEIKDYEQVKFTKSYEYNYHVDENYYHALKNPDGIFEIAWGVNSGYDDGRKFEISYTVENHVTVYNDCAEIYWKLIGQDFGVFCENVTGIINLPKEVNEIEELKVWAHGPLNGTINKESGKKVVFQVQGLEPNTFLEVRLATPVEVFPEAKKVEFEDNLPVILAQEAVFAEEANKAREEYARLQKLYTNIAKVVFSIGIIIAGSTLISNIKKLTTEKKIVPETDWDYFRDIPDENATPAEASFIYYKSETETQNNFSRLFSATLLRLCLKGWITFDKKDDKKDKVLVTLNEIGKEELKTDEKDVYDFMKSLFKIGTPFSMKEFEKKAQKKPEKFAKLGEKIIKNAKKVNEKNGIYSQKQHNKSGSYLGQLCLYIIAIIFSFAPIQYATEFIGIFMILGIINCITASKLMIRYNGFTQKGINENSKWKGLVKFMKDFSLIDEKEIPALVLWEKYLVYATAFGVADKVIKQLKVYFPEMEDDEYLRTHYTYMYFVGDSDMNFVSNINNSIGSVVNYTSASGAGGGFSSGGGGGAGGGGGGGR